jgi:hypothetical protein
VPDVEAPEGPRSGQPVACPVTSTTGTIVVRHQPWALRLSLKTSGPARNTFPAASIIRHAEFAAMLGMDLTSVD